jgi:hypothetical protein
MFPAAVLGSALLAALSALWAPDASAQPLAEAAWRADLAQFRSTFFERDRAYSATARATAEQRLADLNGRSGELDATRFALELAQIAALADNGHTASFGGPRLERSNRVELRLAVFGGQFHVVRTREADRDLLGARLVAIDDTALEPLRQAAHALRGGTPAWRDREAPLLFESPQQLHALGLVQDPLQARYRFETPEGRSVERRLVAAPPSPTRPRADPARLLLPAVTPERHEGADTGWRTLLPLERAPWSLQEATQPLRWRMAPELGALVLDMRRTASSPQARLPEYFAAVRAAIAEHRPLHLVLDLRLNGGGDLTQARDFAESLPTLVAGKIFVLTGPATFSAAISTAGYLKQAAPDRVRIVGEPVGDRLEFFAEGRTVTLPHSGAVLLPATERHDYRNGCRHHAYCHAPVATRPIAVPTLDPDIPAPWTLDSWRRGLDPAMQAVAAVLAGSS